MTRNSTILNDFEQFLKKQSVVRPNQQPYYIRWVQMYLDANTSLDGLGKSVTVKQFVNDLASENGFTDWQVNQAMDAIQLFLQGFMPEKHPEWVAVKSPSFGMDGWSEVTEEVKEVIRLRHLSATTRWKPPGVSTMTC